MDDMDLLREYAQTQSETAFAILAERYVGLVYSAAFRQLGDAHLAQDVTQAVFIVLARKGERLPKDTVMSGWLLKTTRYAANAQIRTAVRRARREKEASMQSSLNENPSEIWDRLAPLLDDAMASLGDTDRNVVAMRYFENKTAQEIATRLKMKEEAAQKRVSRALEKLHRYFSRRGISSSATAIAGAISVHSVQIAPRALAKLASTAAVAKGASAGAPALAIAKGALKIMAWAKAKTAVAVTVTTVLASGVSAFFVYRAGLASIDGTFRSILFKHEYREYAKRFEGTWEGTLAVLMNSGGWTQHRRIVVKIVERDAGYQAVVDEIDDGMKNILVPNLTMNKLAIDFSTDTFAYHGVFHKNATEIRGVWRGLVGSYVLVLTRTNAPDTLPDPLAKADYTPRPGSDLQGVWKTVLTNNGVAQTVYVKIAESANGLLRGEANRIGEGAIVPLPLTGLSYKKPQVHFGIWAIGGNFTGTLSDDGKTLAGQWKHSAPFTPTKVSPIKWTQVDPNEEELALQDGKDFDYLSDSELQGHWKGIFPASPDTPLHLSLDIARTPDGTFTATVDSPDQSLFAVPVDVLEFKPPKLRLEVKNIHATFAGKFADDTLSGKWTFLNTAESVVFERKKP